MGIPIRLLDSLGKTSEFVRGRLNAELAEHGLSIAKFRALQHLAQATEPVPLGQLTEYVVCGKSNITQLIDRLQKDGFVRRVSDAEDRRIIRAEITEEGRRRCNRAADAVSKAEIELLKHLTPDEQSQLSMILERWGVVHH